MPPTTLTCTKLLDWYGPDFGDGPRAVVERLCELLPEEAPLRAALREMLDGADEPTLCFRPYDWGSNDSSA